MIKILIFIFVVLLIITPPIHADLISAVNELNLPKESQEFLGHPYDSHGCFHFYPADAYLIYNILPDMALLDIKTYTSTPDINTSELPWGVDLIKNTDQLKSYKSLLSNPDLTTIQGYPGASLWIIYNKKKPLFKIKALPGPAKPYYLSSSTATYQSCTFDHSLSEATTPGKYYIFGRSDDFYTIHYKTTTIIPMWGKIKRTPAGFIYYRSGRQYYVPEQVGYDLENNYKTKYTFNYFNAKKDKSGKIEEAQWASHDFGKFTIFWSSDKRNVCNEMGYSTGEICYEQMQFLKDMAAALASPTENTLENFLEHFSGYQEYLKIGSFLSGADDFYLNSPIVTTYLKLMYNRKTSPQEWQSLPGQIRAAYKLYYFPTDSEPDHDEIASLNKLGLKTDEKYKIYGIEREMYLYKIAADKLLLKFAYLRKNWELYNKLKTTASEQFKSAKIETTTQKENILYNMLMKRIYFEQINKEDIK